MRALGGELRFESKYGDTRFWFFLEVEGAQARSHRDHTRSYLLITCHPLIVVTERARAARLHLELSPLTDPTLGRYTLRDPTLGRYTLRDPILGRYTLRDPTLGRQHHVVLAV